MEIVAALGGAVVGALVSVALAHLFSGRSERYKAISALKTELKINVEVANRVLKSNQREGSRAPEWYEFIPFLETAWESFVAQGMLSKLELATSKQLSWAYALIRSADFQAQKIQMGTFKSHDAEAYSARVEEARQGILPALESLGVAV